MEENKEGTQQAAQEAYVRQLAELSARVLHMTEEQKAAQCGKNRRAEQTCGGAAACSARAVCSKAAFVGAGSARAAGCAGASAARC